MHRTCKLFHAPPFMLLIVPNNSVYYNHLIITQWLVGSGIKTKRGFAWAKKCTVAPCLVCYIYGSNCLYTTIDMLSGKPG